MNDQRPLIIGEVLFDEFEQGPPVLGGAPLNVAWNLAGFGMNPHFVSAVGDDAKGKEIRSRLSEWGLDTSGVQTSQRLPTGAVKVSVQDGSPKFEILDQQAYDDIRFADSKIASGLPADRWSVLYTGTLAYRNDITRSTIQKCIQQTDAPRFVDINIRQPWFSLEWLDDLLVGARWIKLNHEELAFISNKSCDSEDQIGAAVGEMRERFGEATYLVTCGKSGAAVIDPAGHSSFAQAPEPDPMADSVGAGDAFSAATIYAILQGIPIHRVLNEAVRYASRTCTFVGALTQDRAHYRGFTERVQAAESTAR